MEFEVDGGLTSGAVLADMEASRILQRLHVDQRQHIAQRAIGMGDNVAGRAGHMQIRES